LFVSLFITCVLLNTVIFCRLQRLCKLITLLSQIALNPVFLNKMLNSGDIPSGVEGLLVKDEGWGRQKATGGKKLQVTSYKLLAASHELRATSSEYNFTIYQFSNSSNTASGLKHFSIKAFLSKKK